MARTSSWRAAPRGSPTGTGCEPSPTPGWTSTTDDWRFEVRDGEFYELSSSGGGGEGGAQVFRVPPDKVMVFGDEHGQTTYRFPSA